MENIEFSRNGIKVSYLRFLSDSAIGFIVVLIAIVSYYYPIFGITLQNIPHEFLKIDIPVTISSEVKIFVFILVFLLATPLGLIINALSWIFLGSIRIYLIGMFFDKRFFITNYLNDSTNKAFSFINVSEFFDIDKENFYCTSSYFEEIFDIYCPDISNSIDYVRGLARFSGSIAFLAIVFIIVELFACVNYGSSWILYLILYSFVIFIVFIIISSLIYFYLYSSILFKISIISLKKGSIENIKGDIKKITECLIASWPCRGKSENTTPSANKKA
jgi:hypothetical protein